MDSVIRLLPDVLANQIAAGEVVQRPASVIKELLENAVDAGATRIDVFIKDAGKTLIQVSDNGAGMSASDARMCFERHATSKIRSEADLFNIRSLGFRGEALASIAAVAQVRLRTRLRGEELGQEIDIEAGEVKRQASCTTPEGSIFYVKNLFYNVPARRNFLKSNASETRHILNEITRVAIPRPDIHISFTHNTTTVLDLPPQSVKERLVALFGKELEYKLIDVDEETPYVRVQGLISAPDLYRNNRFENFFFVNRRYIRHPQLHQAIMAGYTSVIPKDAFPLYCVFIEIDPVHVDINIHPTKTEVKFDDERALYMLVHAMVRRGLGSLHGAPTEPDLTDAELRRSIYGSAPPPADSGMTIGDLRPQPEARPRPKAEDWDKLYRPPQAQPPRDTRPLPQTGLFERVHPEIKPGDSEISVLGQLRQSYVLAERDQHLYLIHQRRAHQRILYERFLAAAEGSRLASQQLLFPQTLELSAADYASWEEADPLLARLGFEIKALGVNTLIIYGTPAEIPGADAQAILQQVIADLREAGHTQVAARAQEFLARAVARRAAIPARHSLDAAEMQKLARDLFSCEAPAFSPGGKPVYKVIGKEELRQFFGE